MTFFVHCDAKVGWEEVIFDLPFTVMMFLIISSGNATEGIYKRTQTQRNSNTSS